jgi:Trypsin
MSSFLTNMRNFIVVACAAALAPGGVRALVGPAGPASAGDASRAVMVLSSEAGRAGFCTAAVLSPRIVLTAAHCLPAKADLRIFFRDDSGASVLLGVAAAARHPLYRNDAAKRRERSIDLALIRLVAPLPARFHPIALADEADIVVGQKFRILGYGVAKENDPRTSGALRSGVLAARAPLSKILLWADDPSGRGLGACLGDSGAPILTLDSSQLVAIADWATGRGGRQCGDLTQGALIAPELGWIRSVMTRWRE